MTTISTYSAYRYVKSNRKKKRRELNRMALRILLDKTTAFYLAIFGLMFSFWLRDQFVLYQPTFDWIEMLLSDNFFSVISLAIIRPLLASTTRPGVLFSSSDLFLSMLPYDQKKLWQFHVLDRLKKAAITYGIIGLSLWIMLPLPSQLIISFVIGFWLLEGLMIIPQWLLYQQTWWIKFLISQGVTIVILLINFLAINFDLSAILFLIMIAVLIAINVIGYKSVYQITDWSRIVATNDRLLRKNILISFASKVRIEPPKYQGFYHHVIRNNSLRKPFNPKRKNQMYNRIILIKAIEHKEDIIKLVFSLIGITFLMSILSEVTYGWAIILIIFLYSQLGSRFFLYIFEDRLIFSIPWKIEKWQRLFTRWLSVGFLPLILFLALPGLYWLDMNITTLINWISYSAIGLTLIYDQVHVRSLEVATGKARYPFTYLITVLILVFGVIYSVQSPFVSIFIIIYALIRYTSLYIASKE